MTDEDLSRDALMARIKALEAERRASAAQTGLVRELGMQKLELELQTEALRDAQSQLEAALARYADLYDFAPLPYVTLDVETRVIDANHAAAALLGLERTLIVGKPLLSLVRFPDASLLLSHVTRCLAGGAPVHDELRFATSRGVQEVRFVSAPLHTRDGTTNAVKTVLVDVRGQKKTERDLERARAAEATLRNRLERVSSAYVAVTQAITRMDDTDIAAVLNVLADEARAVTRAEYAAVGIGTDENSPFEHWVFVGGDPAAASDPPPRPNGVLGDVARSARPLRLRDVGEHGAFPGPARPPIKSFLGVPLRHAGRNIGILYVGNKIGEIEFTDADELLALMLGARAAVAVEIARMLRRERRRNDLFQAAAAAFARSVEVTATAQAVADVVVPTFGHASAVDLVGDDGVLRTAAVHHRDPSRAQELARLRGKRLTLSDAIERAVLGDGWPRIFREAPEEARLLGSGSTMFIPLRRDGSTIGLLRVAFTDTAYGAPGEEDLALAMEFAHRATLAIDNARLHETARRALASRDALLSFVSHDLGNFLHTIVISAEVVSQPGPNGERRTAYRHLSSIRSAAVRMTSLLGTLRDATMIDAGQFTVSSAPETLGPLLMDACAMLRARAEVRHVRLDVRLSPDLPLVACDRERVHQVIANLVGNAIDHTPMGGAITVEAAQGENGMVRVAVRDTGNGIAPEDMAHLFERYWHTDTPTRKGTGLGLFITKGIVEAHGGNIWVESEIGVGSTFFFTLPTCSAGDAVPAALAGSPTRSGFHTKADLSEDEERRESG